MGRLSEIYHHPESYYDSGPFLANYSPNIGLSGKERRKICGIDNHPQGVIVI